jgi:hypothetical protein
MGENEQPNRHLVVYALGLLGGEFEKVHTEDLALKCHELFPDVFSWTRHPHLPDKDIVRVALTDARKAKFGALVEGRSGQALGQASKTSRRRAPDGWVLTAAGSEWFRTEGQSIREYSESRELRDHRQAALRRLTRVVQHRTWTTFVEDPDNFSPTLGDLASLLRCRVDAPPNVWERRFANLERDATASDKDTLPLFVARCREAYLAAV